MDRHATPAGSSNDLHRHPLPRFFIKYAVRLLFANRMIRHDAPVSVARAFTASEWRICWMRLVSQRENQDRVVFPVPLRCGMPQGMKRRRLLSLGAVSRQRRRIRLAQNGQDVLLLEKEPAAHDKVCGEFIAAMHNTIYVSSASIWQPWMLSALPAYGSHEVKGLHPQDCPFLPKSLSPRAR